MNAPQTIAPACALAPQPHGGLEVWSILTSLTTGGAESLVVNLDRSFRQAGMTHKVVALCDAATLGNSCKTERCIANLIKDDGGTFVSLGLGRNRNPLAGIFALNRLLQTDRPHVIHAHTARAVPIAAHSRHRGALVMTHHNSRLSFPRGAFRYLDLVVDTYVAISAETEALYRAVCRKPVRRIANGVPESFLSESRPAPRRPPFTVMSVGAISEQKNYRLLIAAACEIRDRAAGYPVAKFRIAGGGQSLESLRREVDAAGLSGSVEFLGERSDVPILLGTADLFLNTSRYEGQSIAMLEAMAMALPVVATDVPGNRNLVVPGHNGLLAPLDDPGAIADAIIRLANDPQLYASMSDGARATGRQFTVEATAADHRALYASLVSNG